MPNQFNDHRLPEDIERGASGGPGFRTAILGLESGAEKRNIVWSRARGRWNIGYGIQNGGQLTTVRDFFWIHNGRAIGFRFKDWSDFRIGRLGDATTRQLIGTGDGIEVDYQIFKHYLVSSFFYDRPITRPISGIEVYVNAVLQTITTHYTVDLTTGIITFVTAPPDTQLVEVICEFDVPVRFDTDVLQVAAELFFMNDITGSVPSIDLVELRPTNA